MILIQLYRVTNRNVDGVFVHTTCAIKTNDINYVFGVVSKAIIKERLKLSGVL